MHWHYILIYLLIKWSRISVWILQNKESLIYIFFSFPWWIYYSFICLILVSDCLSIDSHFSFFADFLPFKSFSTFSTCLRYGTQKWIYIDVFTCCLLKAINYNKITGTCVIVDTGQVKHVMCLEDHVTCNTAAFKSIDWLIVYERSFHLFLSFFYFRKSYWDTAIMSTHGPHSEVVSMEDFPSLLMPTSRAPTISALNMITQWRPFIKTHLSWHQKKWLFTNCDLNSPITITFNIYISEYTIEFFRQGMS